MAIQLIRMSHNKIVFSTGLPLCLSSKMAKKRKHLQEVCPGLKDRIWTEIKASKVKGWLQLKILVVYTTKTGGGRGMANY